MKPKQLCNYNAFNKNIFDDKLNHEVLQLKCGKIILGVCKKASDRGVQCELDMLPLNIGIYVRILKYYSHLIELIRSQWSK